MSEVAFFEDIIVGEDTFFGPYIVRRDELLAFNEKWDRLPMHLDDEAARAMGHRGITASGQYTLCVKQTFVNASRWSAAAVGAMGFDEVRFPHPVYVDDELSCTITCTAKRESRSKPDRGIVTFTFRVYNQNDDTVLSYIDTVMIKRRPQTDAESRGK